MFSLTQNYTYKSCSAEFEKAVERYEGLELDVFDKLKKSFTLTAQQELEINEILNK